MYPTLKIGFRSPSSAGRRSGSRPERAVTSSEGVDEIRAHRELVVMLSSWNASHPDAYAAIIE
jgi:hypothetical protein